MEVTLPSLIFHSEPHFGHRDAWVGGGGGGGELAKEVDFVFMFYYHFSSPFCDVQWLAGSPFYEAVILYSLLFQNLGPFLQPNFLWFCLTSGLKN